MAENNEIDLDQDGKVSNKEEKLYERKSETRRRMAWLALIALVVSGFSMMFLVPETRLKQLDGLLEIYWIALGSITGAYVGISTWMARKQ